jgi:hypothetical protein
VAHWQIYAQGTAHRVLCLGSDTCDAFV